VNRNELSERQNEINDYSDVQAGGCIIAARIVAGFMAGLC
jgi:hypothetical protein